MTKIQITTPGIKKALNHYDYRQAVAEYVWNGFDAQATSVDISYQSTDIGGVTEFSIRDNGYGIPREKLKTKFLPFYESEKLSDLSSDKIINSVMHGKNGVGRLTFFHFSSRAAWDTVYKKDNKRFKYQIRIDIDKLNTYDKTELVETEDPIGTLVSFKNIKILTSYHFETDIKNYLIREFGWFLELNKSKGFMIKINDLCLDYTSLMMGDPESFVLVSTPSNVIFEIKYIQWSERLNNEYSRYYYINSKGDEIFKEATTLNNKGDHFYHSVYIKSELFDDFNVIVDETSKQATFSCSKRDDEFKFLKAEVDKYLRKKRKPFLKAYTDTFIAELEAENAFPKYNLSNPWDTMKKNELENIIRGLYQIEPRLFSNLNTEQKKTLIGLLNLVMDSDEKDKLFDILQGIVDLDLSDRAELAKLLETSRLSGIISTIELIQDRYKAVNDLKELVFNEELGANEKDHLQKMIEKHYWIFGEQYHLVTAAEQKFEEALRRFTYLLTGENKRVKIQHPDSKKEMDIFAVRADYQNDITRSIIVELKHPKIKLGKNELDQVDKYLNVILSQDEFNAPNMYWEFYLVGNGFDSTHYIERQFQMAEVYGEKSLVFKNPRYKTYVKTWAEVFNDFELRHKFLEDKLGLERDKLLVKYTSATDIVKMQSNNSAGNE